MSEKETSGRAFPMPVGQAELSGEVRWNEAQPGMTLRAYAAIKLKVPDSGIDWLDEMIRANQRDEFAAKAMQGFISDLESTAKIIKACGGGQCPVAAGISAISYEYAGAMLKARKS